MQMHRHLTNSATAFKILLLFLAPAASLCYDTHRLDRARLFSWERAANTYRALHRKVACQPLSEEDAHLLSEASAA